MSEPYSKVKPLGRGPFATVYEGRDLALDRPVAIKELALPFASDETTVRSFVDRARRLGAVRHAHLLTLHAVDSSHDSPWLIKELADRTLQDAPAHGAMQPEQMEQLLRQILPALGALHASGLTHGGIKPSNLFVCDKLYKLGDFGFTAAEGGPTADALTPPRYTAPEEIAAGGPRTPAADLYTLGLVAYELLLGEERFAQAVRDSLGGSPAEGGTVVVGAPSGPARSELELWLRFHSAPGNLPSPHDLDPNIPEPLSRVVERLAKKSTAARYASCEAALADLVNPIGSPGGTPRGGGVRTQVVSRPTGRRSRTLLFAVAVSLLLTLVLLALLLARPHDPMVAVTSNPPGAQILFAGEEQGTTPVRLRVKVGTTLTLRKDGFRDAEVTLAAPKQTSLNADLVPKAVAVTSDPAGATVLAAGRELGTTPLAYEGAAGVALTFHKEGFADRTLTVPPGQRELHAELARDPWSDTRLTDAAALADELLRLRGGDTGLSLAFEPPPSATLPRIPLGEVLHFRALSPRAGSLTFFALSADGTIFCVYPSRKRPAAPLVAGQSVSLPLPDDAHAVAIQASEPLGRDVIFALASTAPPPPPPVGDTSNEWLTVYRFAPGAGNPALAFARWVAAVRGQKETSLAALEMEVVARQP
jgi:hypothetical protein